jgi:nucleoid DNA-binding protein
MTWNSKSGKSGLIRMLMAEKGLSKRRAEKAVNAVFARMTAALRRGELVDIPGGTIVSARPTGKPRREWKRLKNVHTGKTQYRIVKYGGRRRIRFHPDCRLDLSAPPPANCLNIPQPEFDAIVAFIARLTGHEPEPELLKRAYRATDNDARRLLIRLDQLRQRNRSLDAWDLEAGVRSLYWIR